LIGTPHYMAPEVLAGEPATSRSDVWALAVVLHEIFFGQRPERRSVSFDGSSKGPIRPGSPTERRMMALCERCLAESPLDRPADAREVARLFDSEGRSPPKGGPLRDKRVMAVFGLVAVLAVSMAIRAVGRHQRETSATRSPRSTTAAMAGSGIRLEAEGAAADWSRTARTILEIPGRVHCFSLVDEKTVRIVWGSPRRAEDVDVDSGTRRLARLAPETFRVGCPELSPNRKALLFTAQTQSGASEIRVSTPDGREAKTVTSGADPLWLGGNDEFLYTVDSSHAAVFSLPTMSFTLLAEPNFGQRRATILDKAVSQTASTVALLLATDNMEFGIAVYDQPPFEKAKVFAVPNPHQIQFEPKNDAIWFTLDAPQSSSTLAELDWRQPRLRSIARYPGFDLMWAAFPVGRATSKLLMARHSSSDVWLYSGKEKKKLTEDGADYSADLSPSGDLLVSRQGSDGAFSIWLRRADGSEKRLTSGPRDIGPAFSRDGRFWTYSDYAMKSVMLCPGTTGECHVLHKDEVLPMWPRFSPDGTSIAYVSGMGSPKVTIISAADGRVRNSWDGEYQCAPVWSTTKTIWFLEAGAGRYYWSERNAVSGEKTGRRVEVVAENMAVGELECGSTLPDSPVFQPLRIEREEISKLLEAS
jgi:WD40 repeat protein